MGWYITILQEMRDQLGLKGNELIVFAFIYGYSQGGHGCYHGSLAYLQGVCGIASRQTATDVLKSLMEKGYIRKDESIQNGVRIVCYSACLIIGQGVQKMDMGCPKNGRNNNSDIDINNTLSNKGQTSRFIKPSVEEIRNYCSAKSLNIDAEQFFNFYESKGWKVGKTPMVNWHAAVATWANRGEAERRVKAPRTSAPRKESVLEHNLKVMDQMFGTNLHEQTYGKKEDYDEQ